MTGSRLTVLAFVTVILLGGLNGIAAKQVLREVEPFWSGAIRSFADQSYLRYAPEPNGGPGPP